MQISLRRDSETPLYRQVADQIGPLVRSGALPPGHRLPPVRQLATELGLTRLTVHAAYAELQSQGLVESFVGRGSFVAARPATAAPGPAATRPPTPWLSQGLLAELTRIGDDPRLISFAQAAPAPETYPTREFGRALRLALDDPGALGYGPIQGETALREEVSHFLLDRGVVSHPDHVLITAGVQQGIDVALRALTGPDDVILVEEPTYPGAIEVAAQQRRCVVGVPVDQRGIAIAALEAACQVHRPRLLYTVPTYHNPTGVSLGPERRADLLRIARAYDLLVVEDDIYGLLGYDAASPLPLKASDPDGRVVYLTSFSKILIPGLRLGCIVAAPGLLPGLAAAKQSSDLLCSPLLQRALAEYLRRGYLSSHLQRVRKLYRQRRDAMRAALQRFLPGCPASQPEGGLSIWVALPEGVDERSFWGGALERGVGVARGQAFFAQPERSAHVRLSFGAHSPGQIERGVAILGEVLADQLHRRDAALARAGHAATPLV